MVHDEFCIHFMVLNGERFLFGTGWPRLKIGGHWDIDVFVVGERFLAGERFHVDGIIAAIITAS